MLCYYLPMVRIQRSSDLKTVGILLLTFLNLGISMRKRKKLKNNQTTTKDLVIQSS